MEARRNAIRVEFSKEHDSYLYKYLARYCPSQEGRRGQKVFQRLVANENNTWPWSVHHTWQSWRERYVKNTERFDALILNYQRKHGTKSTERSKRAAEPTPIEMLGPSAKRVKLDAQEKAPISKTSREQGAAAQHAISRSSKSNSIPKCPREPQEAPNSQSHRQPKPRPTDVRPSSIPRSNNDTNTDTTKKPSLDLPALQTRHETLDIPSSSLNQPAPIPADGEPDPRSSPHSVKHVKKRHRTPSELFASEPSSPRRDPAVVDVGNAPVTDTVYPRAPPRVVDSLHGQTMVDQNGYVPRAFPHGKDDGAEEEKEQEENARWPPPRSHTAKQRTVSGLGNEVDTHHAFSQTQPHRVEASQEGMVVAEREQGKPHHLFGQISRRLDQCTVTTLLSAGLSHGVAPQLTGEGREDMIRDGTSPIKRIIATAPASALLSGLIPNPASKAFEFPAPRASTRSPFRPEPPAGETRHPAPPLQSRIQATRHPAWRCIRRQTIDGNANGNGHERENGRGREHGQVPSVDLVALSRSSMSARSHSRSSTDTSIPGRPPRWSLPSFAHATPWVTDEPEGASLAPGSMLGSGSGSPFRWVAPSPVYADILGLARTSSLGGTSTPQLMFTPSPARSITAVPTDTKVSAPLANPNPTSPPISISPHPPDVLLAASHGLASILAHMSANHGLALNVVEAVYARVGCLREADEVLNGMRKAAEGFGEREIEKKTRGRHKESRRSREAHEGRHRIGQGGRGDGDGDGDGKEQKRTVLRYVAASEDGEGSEYSPPWTSRAAMWKQQSESVSYVEEEGEEDMSDEEEEEGRVVEEQLLEEDRAGENDEEDRLADGHHDFSQVFMEDMRAREAERQMGRTRFHREIVKQFL